MKFMLSKKNIGNAVKTIFTQKRSSAMMKWLLKDIGI